MHFNINFTVSSADDLIPILREDVKAGKLPIEVANFIQSVVELYPYDTAFHVTAFGELDVENIKDVKISAFVTPIASFRKPKE